MDGIRAIWEKVTAIFTHTFLEVEIWRLIVAGIILILTFSVRKLFVSIVLSLLKKLTSKTKTTLDDQLVSAVDPPARLLIITLGISLTLSVLRIPVGSESFAGHIIRSLVIIAVFWTIYRAGDIFSGIYIKLAKKTETTLDDLMAPYISKGIKVIVIVVGISVIAKEWRYDLGALLTGLGLGGLAFALAAQETVSNFFGGLTIMVDKPFAVGDWILTPNVEGTVEDIGFRSTRVRTFDQALVTVPNSIIAKGPITNWSRMGKRRITFRLGVKYDTKADRLETLLHRIRGMLESHPEVHPQTIFVYFDGFGENALEIFLYLFTKTTDWQKHLEVREDINFRIMRILDELKLEVALPSMSVYLGDKEKKRMPEE